MLSQLSIHKAKTFSLLAFKVFEILLLLFLIELFSTSLKAVKLISMCVLIAGRIENLPKLVEDIVQTSINTGPRGALRLVQGVQAFLGVGGEWLNDLSKVTLFLGTQICFNCIHFL